MADIDGWVELRARGRVLMDTHSASPTAERRTTQVSEGLVDAPRVQPLQASDRGGNGDAAIIHPVQRNGETVLNIVVTLRAAEMQRIIDAQALPEGWIGTVLDSRGTVVARHPGGIAFVGRSATGDLKQLMSTSREAFFNSVSLDGLPMVGYFRTSARDWTYVAAMPQSQFAGYIPQAAVQVVVGALLLLALAVGGAFLVSRRIVATVQSLRDIAARMRAGEPVPPGRTGIAEFDDVAAALTQAANALQDHGHELERQVDAAVERTRQAEQRASQSQRIEALGRLTGGVAHDFNNLLGVISNSAHLIQRHADSPDLKAPVAATLRAVEAGSRLTQHLLRVAGRRPLSPERVHLDRHLPELEALLHSVLGRRIEVSVRVAAGTWPVNVDTSELELALINLALNARDAMPTGGELQVQARNAEDAETEGAPDVPARHCVLIAVTDTGTGMPPEVAQRAFEPFFTTKEVGKGTGLGLSQVHGFCTQAGGTARVDSTPGLGTTVSLLLPAALDLVVAGAPELTPAAEIDLVGTRILVVDDNRELSRGTAALLQSHGVRVERAQNAAEALFLLAIQPDFDIILTDVMMPGELDGLGLARRLRNERPALPVVLVSGYKADLTPGEFILLAKPVAPNELL
ncbi:MAG: ATP-binding protein, partial [Pseudomonadota bacterium]